MRCCPQLTRVFLGEPRTTPQVGRCTTVNENRIHEQLPGPVRHDFCPACIRNSCYWDGNNNNEKMELNSSQYDSLYDIEPPRAACVATR